MAEMQSAGVSSGSQDDLARELNEICRSATFDLVFRIGQLVIQRVFNADQSAWERGGPRRRSYRALAARPDLALSASALCRAVSIYVLVERLGGRSQLQHLGASHLQEVLPLAFDSQRELLTRANQERWSVSRLRSEARRQRRDRRLPAPRRTARALRRLAERVADQTKALQATPGADVCGSSVVELKLACEQLRRELQTIERALDAALPSESDIRELGACRA